MGANGLRLVHSISKSQEILRIFFQHNGKWSDVPYIKAFIYFMCVCVCLFRAVLMALGGSQATG